MTATYLLRSSTDVVAAVPFVLGFHPAESLVAVGLQEQRVLFAARYDLPPADTVEEQARHLADVTKGQGVNGIILIGYGPAEHVTPAIQHAADAIRRSGMSVVDELRVTEGQFWSYLCTEDGCCPKPCPPPDSEVAAEATFAGQVALPDRAALVAQLAPVTGPEREAMTAATVRAQRRLTDEFAAEPHDEDFSRALRRTGRRAVRDAERRYRSGSRLTDDEVAWLGVMLVDVKVRDYAWERTGEEEWRLSFWTDVLRRVEPGYVPAPAALLSFAAWRQGSGALATSAADRALAHDPDYGMAVQMELVLSQAVSPAAVRNWPSTQRLDSGASSSGDDGGPGGGAPGGSGSAGRRREGQGRVRSGGERRVRESRSEDQEGNPQHSTGLGRGARPQLRQPGTGQRAGSSAAHRPAHRRQRRRSL